MKFSITPRHVFIASNFIIVPLLVMSLIQAPNQWILPLVMFGFLIVGWYDVIQKKKLF